jgi:hypothetical protein
MQMRGHGCFIYNVLKATREVCQAHVLRIRVTGGVSWKREATYRLPVIEITFFTHAITKAEEE